MKPQCRDVSWVREFWIGAAVASAVFCLFFGVVNLVLVRLWARRTIRWFLETGAVVLADAVYCDCLTGRDRGVNAPRIVPRWMVSVFRGVG